MKDTPEVDVVITGATAAAVRCAESVLSGMYPRTAVHLYAVIDAGSEGAAASAGQARAVKTDRRASRGLRRNQGWRTGDSAYVQFVRADSVLNSGWLRAGIRTLLDDPDLAAVYGTCVSHNKKSTVFDWLAGFEHNPQAGDVSYFAQDVLIRRKALEEVGGYHPRIRYGENPELSLRLLSAGWRIRKLDAAMSRNNGRSLGIGRFLRRAYENGYACAVITALHGFRGGYWIECVRIVLRGFLAPACVVAGQYAPFSIWTGWVLSLAGLAAFFYPRLFLVEKFMQRMNFSEKQARLASWHAVLVVLPECIGLLYALPRCLMEVLRPRRTIRGDSSIL